MATAGVIARPFSWPEFVWAGGGATLLVVADLLPLQDALAGIGKGIDVYLFLVGMMLLAEVARQEGVVDRGPNLSVTGSLATILWLTALRREDQEVGAWAFLKLGVLVMPPALVLAIAGVFAFG